MFNALIVSTASGTGRESGRPWYKISLIAETVLGAGSNVILENYCTETAFRDAQTIPSMARVKVACGVTENGKLCVHHVREEKS